MGHGGIGYQRDIGLCRGRAESDFPVPIGAHLDYREAMPGFELQQGQGHADGIVQIGAGRQAFAFERQNRAQHLLDRGLALAAGNGKHPGRGTLAIHACDPRQRQTGICDEQLRQIFAGNPADHRTRRSAALRLGNELVAVEVLAAESDEQLARTQSAGVGGYRVETGIGADQFGLQLLGQRIEHHGAYHSCVSGCASRDAEARSSNAFLTTPASLKRLRFAPISW